MDFAESSTAMLLQKNLQVMEEKMSEEENEKRLKFEYEVCAKTLDYLALVVFVSLFIMITLAYIAATMSHSVLHHQWRHFNAPSAVSSLKEKVGSSQLGRIFFGVIQYRYFVLVITKKDFTKIFWETRTQLKDL